jgi:hypothetical protein
MHLIKTPTTTPTARVEITLGEERDRVQHLAGTAGGAGGRVRADRGCKKGPGANPGPGDRTGGLQGVQAGVRRTGGHQDERFHKSIRRCDAVGGD